MSEISSRDERERDTGPGGAWRRRSCAWCWPSAGTAPSWQRWTRGGAGRRAGPSAASQAPPHLEAVVSEKALLELYQAVRPSGVLACDLIRSWSRHAYPEHKKLTAPVEGDSGRVLLERAVSEHRENVDVYGVYRSLPFCDGRDPALAAVAHRQWFHGQR